MAKGRKSRKKRRKQGRRGGMGISDGIIYNKNGEIIPLEKGSPHDSGGRVSSSGRTSGGFGDGGRDDGYSSTQSYTIYVTGILYQEDIIPVAELLREMGVNISFTEARKAYSDKGKGNVRIAIPCANAFEARLRTAQLRRAYADVSSDY